MEVCAQAYCMIDAVKTVKRSIIKQPEKTNTEALALAHDWDDIDADENLRVCMSKEHNSNVPRLRKQTSSHYHTALV